MDVCTPRGRLLEYKETVGRIVVLDYDKSILSKNVNPSKFDFNHWDLDLHLGKDEKNKEVTEDNPGGPTISFRLHTNQLFQVRKGDRLGCPALIPTAGVPNWTDDDQVQEEYKGDAVNRQRWPSML